MQWFLVVLVGLLGVLLWVTPQLSRRTVPLGVSVPTDRVDDPVVRRGIRRFHISVAVATVATVMVVSALWQRPEIAASFAPILLLAGGLISFTVCRRPIIDAKRAGRWYDGHPVRLQASVGSGSEPGYRVRWILGAAVIPVGAALVTVVQYPSLPRRVPTHFGFTGEPDQYSDKSVLTVFGVLFLAVGIGALLAGLSVWATRGSTRISPDGRSAQAAKIAARRKATMTARLLDQIGALVVLGISVMQLSIVLQWPPSVLGATGVAVVTVPLIVVVFHLMSYLHTESVTADTARSGPQSPDDDDHWRGGLVYLNRSDPAFWVPKRSGIGMTINLGRPAGLIVSLVLVVLILLGIAGSLLLG
ncbi:MAG: DUF1648 domain-containing protein [Allobranchiibius sp.]